MASAPKIETSRLYLREIEQSDYPFLCDILQNVEVMYAWEHAFTDAEVQEWLDKNRTRYANEGFAYFAAIQKDTGAFIGVLGPLIEEIEGEKELGIAYILNQKYWGMGYALEGARACVDYAFHTLHVHRVIAEIRPNNLPSRRLAEKLGMQVEREFIKYYNHTNMPHLLYSITRELYEYSSLPQRAGELKPSNRTNRPTVRRI